MDKPNSLYIRSSYNRIVRDFRTPHRAALFRYLGTTTGEKAHLSYGLTVNPNPCRWTRVQVLSTHVHRRNTMKFDKFESSHLATKYTEIGKWTQLNTACTYLYLQHSEDKIARHKNYHCPLYRIKYLHF